MPLSAAELLQIYVDTLRGLEADRARAEILAQGDEAQARRLPILDLQIAAAQAKIDEAQDAAEADAQQLAQETRDAGVAAAEEADPAAFTDDYESLTVADLRDRAEQKGIGDQLKSHDRKADIISVLRGDDLT
jgi:hypothetical protein